MAKKKNNNTEDNFVKIMNTILNFRDNQVAYNHQTKEVILRILEGLSDHEERLRKLEEDCSDCRR